MSGAQRVTRSKAKMAGVEVSFSPASPCKVSSPRRHKQLKIEDLKGIRYPAKKTPTRGGKAGRKNSSGTLKNQDKCHEVIFIDQCSPSSCQDLASFSASSSPEEDEEILRNFDFDSTFGSCRGITRMERYERALKFKLDPPPSPRIKEILVARKTNPEFSKW